MKKIFRTFPMLLLVSSLFSFTNNKGQSMTDSKKIEIAFTQVTGFTELVMIRESLAQKHIVLSYQKIEYDDKGNLKALSFKVDCQDGFSGSASTTNISNARKFGFFRDYTDKASTPFAVGSF